MDKVSAVILRIHGQRVYVDTNIFIYFLEKDERFFHLVLPFFQCFNDGLSFAYTGDAVVTETLYRPYATDNILKVNEFKSFFSDDEFITVLPHTTNIFELTAEIAPKRKMKLVDALHYSTALISGCQFILTNDRGFVSSANIEVIQLDDLK